MCDGYTERSGTNNLKSCILPSKQFNKPCNQKKLKNKKKKEKKRNRKINRPNLGHQLIDEFNLAPFGVGFFTPFKLSLGH